MGSCFAARSQSHTRPRGLRTASIRISALLPVLLLTILPALAAPLSDPTLLPTEQPPAIAEQSDQARPQPDAQTHPARPEATPRPAEPAAPAAGQARRISLLGRTATLAEGDLPPDVRHFQENWHSLLARHHPDVVFGAATSPVPGPIRTQWKNIIARMPSMPPEEKLRIINGFFNNWSSESDLKNYGREEYWASPEEFLAKGGDCEDYAFIKYLALRHFGWPADDLWIVFVRDRINKGDHAVLAARVKDRVFILDNLSRPAYLLIPEKQYAQQVTPLYALNEQGVWVFSLEDSGKKETKAGPPARP